LSVETSAGGLVLTGLAEAVRPNGSVDMSKIYAALIGRVDRRGRLLWSMPQGHVEEHESHHSTAEREVWEETGIAGTVIDELGTIDYWFVSEGTRIHKTVHHHLLRYVDGQFNDEDPRGHRSHLGSREPPGRTPRLRRRTPPGPPRPRHAAETRPRGSGSRPRHPALGGLHGCQNPPRHRPRARLPPLRRVGYRRARPARRFRAARSNRTACCVCTARRGRPNPRAGHHLPPDRSHGLSQPERPLRRSQSGH